MHHKSCVAASGIGRDDLYDVKQGYLNDERTTGATSVLFSARKRFNMGADLPARRDAEPSSKIHRKL